MGNKNSKKDSIHREDPIVKDIYTILNHHREQLIGISNKQASIIEQIKHLDTALNSLHPIT